MESLIKLECHTPPELDICENDEPGLPQVTQESQDISKLNKISCLPNRLSVVSPLEENVHTKVDKKYGKRRELYVKLVRFDSPSTKKPINKIRVKDFGVFPNDKPQTKTGPEKKIHFDKEKHGSSKPQPCTSLAAKLMHAYFVRSPVLQSILNDVLELQKNCNNQIDDSSIETEIRTIKEQYNLFDVDPTEVDIVEDDSFYEQCEPMYSFNVVPEENSISNSGSSTMETNEPQYVIGMETTTPDPQL